jgi:hypothetical protein
MSTELLVESVRRLVTSASSSNFKIRLNKPVQADRIELLSVDIPNTIYNVNLSNNRLYFNDGMARTAVITPGNYTSNTLKAAVESAFAASGTSLTITYTYSQSTFKVTLAGSAPFSLSFDNTDRSIASVLGFSKVNLPSASSHTGQGAISLQQRPLMLVIDIANTNLYTTDDTTGTFMIPVNTDGGFTIQYRSGLDFEQKTTTIPERLLQNFDVRLCYTDNVAVDLNGSEWNFLLRLT